MAHVDFGRKPIEVHFEEIELTIKMPVDVDCYCMAIRALWVKYDHYSDCATSYFMPKLPDEYESMYAMSKIFSQNLLRDYIAELINFEKSCVSFITLSYKTAFI